MILLKYVVVIGNAHLEHIVLPLIASTCYTPPLPMYSYSFLDNYCCSKSHPPYASKSEESHHSVSCSFTIQFGGIGQASA